MVNPRLCETLFKNPRPNYKSSRLRDCSTCSEPEIPTLLFRMPRFRDWADIFRDAWISHRAFYTPATGRLKHSERSQDGRMTKNVAQPRATVFRHSAVLSLPAVLLRKVQINLRYLFMQTWVISRIQGWQQCPFHHNVRLKEPTLTKWWTMLISPTPLRRLERVFLVAIVFVKRWKIPKKDIS